MYLEKMDYKSYGFSDAILDRKLFIDLEDWGGLLATKKEWTLRELISTLEKAYCGKIGVEYMHIPDQAQQRWIRDKIELRQF